MPFGVGASISEENVVRSTHVEHTSLGVENNSPEGSVDGADTLSPASRVLLGWVGGVLWLLPLVAPRLTMWRGIVAGDGVGSPSDEEWLLNVKHTNCVVLCCVAHSYLDIKAVCLPFVR